MRSLPVDNPGTPDYRSAARYLLWLTRTLAPTVAGGALFAVVWMLSQALMPAAIGKAVDDGISDQDTTALAFWTGVLLLLGLVQAGTGVMRHRFAVFNWLSAAYRTVQVTTRQAVRLGATLPKRITSGEVISVGTTDVNHMGNAMEVLARGAGSVVAILAIGTIMLTTSVTLGLVVLIGVPLMALIVGPMLRPLHRAQRRHRQLTGELTTRSGDIVAGLRVLRGIGGEEVFGSRYREESQAVRHAGVRVARADSMLDGAEVLLTGALVALVTWLGARFAVSGNLTPGQLVTFYGYAVFLIHPVRTLNEVADKMTKAHVSARRVVRILAMEPELPEAPELPRAGVHGLRAEGALTDPASGLVVEPGRITAVTAADPADAVAIADRLGRFADADVSWGGVPLRDLPLANVRERILVADNEARLFSGRLRDELDPRGTAHPGAIDEALDAASARDIVDALPDGLDGHVAEGGREFSGGQRQRLRLARALVADPEVLILVEPTSAVDAHTEARIAASLAGARRSTTVICTTSPLVLDRADHVAYVEAGEVVAEGTHAGLLATEPRYAATVTRGEDTEATAGEPR